MTEPIVHDLLRYAIRWARAVLWQAERLRTDAHQPPGPAQGARPGWGDRVAIEHHFLLVAAGQLGKALQRLEPPEVLPGDLGAHLRILRNVPEHSEDWHKDTGSQRTYRENWPDETPFETRFEEGKDVVLGGVVSLNELERPAELYERATDEARRDLNTASFERLYLDDTGVRESVLTTPVRELREAAIAYSLLGPTDARRASKGADHNERLLDGVIEESDETRAYLLADVVCAGSNKHALVPVMSQDIPDGRTQIPWVRPSVVFRAWCSWAGWAGSAWLGRGRAL